MDNKADMVILFVSHEIGTLTLLKFGQILTCQNQKLQIPMFMVYKAPDVQLTKSKYDTSVMKICPEILWQPFWSRFVFLFVIYVSVLFEPGCIPDALSSILHIQPYVLVDFFTWYFFL